MISVWPSGISQEFGSHTDNLTHFPRPSLSSIRRARSVPLSSQSRRARRRRLLTDLAPSLLQVLISRLFRADLKYVACLYIYSSSEPARPDSLYLALSLSCARAHRRSIADVFRIQVVSNPDVRSPIITLGSTSFFHVRINNIYVLAVTK